MKSSHNHLIQQTLLHIIPLSFPKSWTLQGAMEIIKFNCSEPNGDKQQAGSKTEDTHNGFILPVVVSLISMLWCTNTEVLKEVCGGGESYFGMNSI